ncbi:MAG TPA: riboflavin synthase [Acidimicrobiia bacterium]|jgi:riboflavin synthase|nr:riboflavin synthase [Acidimicrobiia bacterium]
MFTGIVEELGRVRGLRRDGPARLEVEARAVVADATVGASIAVNGCCLTVVEVDDAGFAVDLAPETLDRSTLGGLEPGDPVNLERPVRLADRLGGHLVQGHVDGVGTVAGRAAERDGSVRLTVAATPGLLRHVVEKGSVTVDGVSLTVTAVADDRFEVALIPHTLAVTTLGARQPGDGVNLETDLVAKYVERLLDPAALGR